MASKHNAIQRLLRDYQGPESEKRKLGRILEKADFSQEYGVLAYSLAELQAAGKPMTTATQNYVASKVIEQFDLAYQEYLKDFKAQNPAAAIATLRGGSPSLNTPLSRDVYFSKNRNAYFDVLNRPIDLGLGREQVDPRSGKIMGQIMPGAFEATTVNDSMNWLGLSEIPQVLQQLVHSERNPDGSINWRSVGNHFIDEFQAGWERAYASIPNYKPPVPGKQNNFSLFFGDQSLKGIRDFRDAEKVFAGGKVSLDLFGSDDEEGSTTFPGDGGGVDAYGAPMDASGGISADNSFTERSFFPDDPSLQAKVRDAIPRVQAAHPDDVFGNYSRLNVQTGQINVDETFENGDYGRAGVSAWMYGYDPRDVQVFGIDPDSPAAQAGMKEGAFLQSFNRVLKSGKLPTLVDAVQNGNAFSIAYMQPDDQGVMQEYVSLINPGAVVGRSADQGKEDNWIRRLANTFDPEMGTTLHQLSATWRKTESGDYEYISRPAVSRTPGRTSIPTELWTTDERYATGMYPDGEGNWQLAPLSARPGGRYNVRVNMTPHSMKTFGDLYDTAHGEWTKKKPVLQKAENEARKTVMERYQRAVKAGNADKFPALETAIHEETLRSLRKAGFQPQAASFLTSGLLMENTIREISKNVTSTPADVEPEYTVEQFDAMVNAAPKQEQKWARPVSEAVVRNQASSAQLRESIRSHLNELNSFTRWLPSEDAEKAEFEDQDILGASPGAFADVYIPDEVDDYTAPSMQQQNRILSRLGKDPVMASRMADSADQETDLEFLEANENGAYEDAERAYQGAIQVTANPHAPEASNSAIHGAYGAQAGYFEGDWRDVFMRANALHPENYQTYKALEGIRYAENRKKAEQARAARPLNSAKVVPSRSLPEPPPADTDWDTPWSDEDIGIPDDDIVPPDTFDFWENRNEYDFIDGNTPADRQAKAAYAYGQQIGDMRAAREKVLYPQAHEGTPMPARNLPHFTEDVQRRLGEEFTNPDFEESGFLLGRLNDKGGVDIFDVVKPEQKGRVSRHRTFTTKEMVEEAQRAADEKGGFLAGYVHTHPGDPSQEPQYLRPSNTDVLTRSLQGAGSMNKANWGRDTANVIFNPLSGNYRAWNHGNGVVFDVTDRLKEPSERPARVGLRRNRQVFQGVEVRNSFEDFENGEDVGNIPPPPDEEFSDFPQEPPDLFDEPAPRPSMGYTGPPGFNRPDEPDLNALQNSIYYEHFNSEEGDDQAGRLAGQVQTYQEDFIQFRERFDIIRPWNASDDPKRERLKEMLAETGGAVSSAFGPAYNVGEMEVISDPDLPEGYVRMGARVEDPAHPRRPQNNGPAGQQSSGNGNNGHMKLATSRTPFGYQNLPDDHPGRKPENFPRTSPPGEGWKLTYTRNTKTQTAWGRKNAQDQLVWMQKNEDGQMEELRSVPGYGRVFDPDNQLTNFVSFSEFTHWEAMNAPIAAPSNTGHPTPVPQRGRELPIGDPGRNPANFPAVPGAEGWKLSFSRNYGKERVTAWGRKDSGGNLAWMEPNAAGEMEPLQDFPGWGKVWNENDELVNQVDYKEYDRWQANGRPVSASGISSVGNTGPAVNKNPALWPEKPEEGWALEQRGGGGTNYFFSMLDPDTGEYAWYFRSANELRKPERPIFHGVITDKDGNTLHDVSYASMERHFASQLTPPSSRASAAAQTRQNLADLDPEIISPENRNFSRAYNRFARNLRGEVAASYVQRHMEMQAAGARQEAAAEGRAYVEPENWSEAAQGIAKKAFREKVLEAWEHFGQSVDNYKVDDAARYLSEQFGDEDTPEVPREGDLRAAALSIMEQKRFSGGRWTEGARQVSAGPGSWAPSMEGRSIEEIRSARQSSASWKTRAMARLEYAYTPENVFSKKAAGSGLTGRVIDEHDNLVSLNMEQLDHSTGELVTTATHGEIKGAMGYALTAFEQGSSGTLPQAPDQAMATIRKRTQQVFYSMMDDLAEKLEKTEGIDQTEARSRVQKFKSLAFTAMEKLFSQAAEAMSETWGNVDNSNVSDIQHNAVKPHSVEKARQIASRSKAILDQLGDQDLEAIMKQDRDFIVEDENKHAYNLGGVAVSSTGNNRYGPNPMANGMFGASKFGSMLYGAYMLKREWQMAGAPVFAAAEKYAEAMAEYAPLLYNGEQLSGTSVGYTLRRDSGQSFMGRAAYSEFGAFMDIPYRLSQSNNISAARLLQTGGIGLGIAAGAQISAGMMALGGGALAAAAPVLGTAGLVVGGTLMAGTLGMEAYNTFFKPDDAPDLTFSKIATDAEKDLALKSARQKRQEALYGKPETSTGEYAAYGLSGGLPGMGGFNSGNPFAIFSAQDQRRKYDSQGEIPVEELMKYMRPSDQLLWKNEKLEKEAAELSQKVTGIRSETLEDEASLKKALAIQKRYMGKTDPERLMEVSRISTRLSMGSDENLQQGMTYADQMGYIQGTPEFSQAMMNFSLEGDIFKRAGMQYTGSRVAQLGAQLQATMGADPTFANLGTQLVRQYGIGNSIQAASTASMANTMQQYSRQDLTPVEQSWTASISSRNSPFVNNIISNAMGMARQGGIGQFQVFQMGSALSNLGMTETQAQLLGQTMTGDMGAFSYNAWHKGGPAGDKFLDQAGRPIYQHDGLASLAVYNKWAPQFGGAALTGTPLQQASQLLGTNNREIAQTYLDGGIFGLQRLSNQKSYEASMASAGIALKGIALQENFNWGANAGGTWNQPTAGSAWGIENRQLALQDASTRAGFVEQQQRMSLQNDFAIQREQNQLNRMNLTASYQAYQWSANYNQFRQQQVWTRQDYSYQDTTRGLQFQWQMEDLDEAIRSSSGRERRQLVRQRDRAATMHNLEGDQIDTSRKRQEELWAAQDERYRKEREYTLENQKLDRENYQINLKNRETFYKLDVESFERRMKEYEEEKKLQDELRDLQRKFQYDQLQLQKESAQVQAGAAAVQKEINDAIINGQEAMEKSIYGPYQEMVKYADKAALIFNALKTLTQSAANANPAGIDKLTEFVKSLQSAAGRTYKVNDSYDLDLE